LEINVGHRPRCIWQTLELALQHLITHAPRRYAAGHSHHCLIAGAPNRREITLRLLYHLRYGVWCVAPALAPTPAVMTAALLMAAASVAFAPGSSPPAILTCPTVLLTTVLDSFLGHWLLQAAYLLVRR